MSPMAVKRDEGVAVPRVEEVELAEQRGKFHRGAAFITFPAPGYVSREWHDTQVSRACARVLCDQVCVMFMLCYL